MYIIIIILKKKSTNISSGIINFYGFEHDHVWNTLVYSSIFLSYRYLPINNGQTDWFFASEGDFTLLCRCRGGKKSMKFVITYIQNAIAVEYYIKIIPVGAREKKKTAHAFIWYPHFGDRLLPKHWPTCYEFTIIILWTVTLNS